MRLPLEETEIDARAYEKSGDPTIAPAAAAAASKDGAGPVDVGGYASTYGKVEIVQSIPHTLEVHRARVMPQQSHIIATKNPSSDVYVFDRSRHPAHPGARATPTPDFKLVGHEKEGYGLSWSAREQGLLLSGSEDHLVCLWDLSSKIQSSATVFSSTIPSLPQSHTGATSVLQALHTYRGHSDIVEDVQWSPHHSHQFASCGDDKFVIIWDKRVKENNSIAYKIEAHSGEVNALSFNPINENLLISGSSDRTLALWDLRATSSKLHSFESHNDQITAVEWSPFSETILASASADRRINIWDVTKIGKEQDPEDAEDGPPELLFVHGGHTDKIVDLNWNLHEEWVLASVADDNTVQVWQIAESIIHEEAEEEEKEPPPEDLE